MQMAKLRKMWWHESYVYDLTDSCLLLKTENTGREGSDKYKDR